MCSEFGILFVCGLHLFHIKVKRAVCVTANLSAPFFLLFDKGNSWKKPNLAEKEGVARRRPK